jgi:integrase
MKSHWPNTLIDEIKNADTVKYINKLAKDFGENTVKKYIVIMNAVFEFAVDNDMLIKNPMKKNGEKKLKVPKTAKKPKKPRSYNETQERLLIDHSKTQGIDGLTVFIPLKVGTRPGETISFNPPRDVDFTNKTIHVQETIKMADPERKTGEPKTETSDRVVPVDDEFLDHIKSFGFTGYIYDNGTGIPKNYNNWYNKNFKRLMNSIPVDKEEFKDFPKLNPHEMRHTYGTLLYKRGTDLYTIMKLMGHADIKVTQIYVDHNVELMREKINKNKKD